MAAFAYTNGYFVTMCFILAPKSMKGAKQKDRAGNLMANSVLLGIISGTIIAFAFNNVGHVSTDN